MDGGTATARRPLFQRFYWRDIGDLLLVLDRHALEFTLLNDTAAFLWLSLLDQRHDCAALTAQIAAAAAAATDPAVVRPDVDATLAHWRHLGWTRTAADNTWCIPSRTDQPPPPPYDTVTVEAFDDAVRQTAPEWTMDMDFIGTPVRVVFHADPSMRGTDSSVRLATFLRGVPRAAEVRGDPIRCHVARDGIFLRLGDTCVRANDVPDAISRVVLWCFHLAYGQAGFLGTFHAAAVGRASGTILMPGLSGVGKSTLTAWLAASGWAYGGDDIVGLAHAPDGAGHVVLPFGSAISVKRGAEPMLRPLYPELPTLPEIRYDTKTARFPAVPAPWHMGRAIGPRRIRAIVFPHHAEGAETRLTAMSTRDALLALVGVGYRAGERLDPDLLDGVFDFLDDTPKHRLDFSDPDAAGRVLEGLL